MFFILSKILSFLIKPTFWILLLIISSIIFKSKRKKLLYISLFAFWFFGNGYIVDISYRMWEDDAISVSELDKTYEYGIVLGGFSEYDNKKDRIEFNDSGELFIINMFIDEYSFGNQFNHQTRSQRKLLLNKKELKKLFKEVRNTGLTIIPLKVYINDKGFAKVLISLAKGKKIYDKREAIKNRENKIQLDRLNKK